MFAVYAVAYYTAVVPHSHSVLDIHNLKNLTVEIPAVVVVVVVAPVVDHKSNFAELRVAGWYTRYLFDWQD